MSQPTRDVELINNRLIDLFGIDTITGQAIWRVAWSEDQFEYRHGTYDDYTKGGIYIRTVTEVRYVPKYRQWLRNRFVLEKITLIPECNIPELPANKLSYEPMFPFQDRSGEFLPPKIEACEFVIHSVLAAQGKSSLAKYKDPDDGLTTEEQLEKRDDELNALQAEMFGNETEIGDALAYHQGVVVPHSYKKEN